jgi:RHS repeat-associated protein
VNAARVYYVNPGDLQLMSSMQSGISASFFKHLYSLSMCDGLVTSSSFMDRLITTQTRDNRGYEISRQLKIGNTVLNSFSASYDGATGNLTSRQTQDSPAETFEYDNLDRLIAVKKDSRETMRISYANNGNIISKTGLGNYYYDLKDKPHATRSVDNDNGELSGAALLTVFNDFGKIDRIEDSGTGYSTDFSYGPDMERWYSALHDGASNSRSTIYAGNYERVTENGITREFYYLDGNTIVIKDSKGISAYQAFTDNIGSILCVIDENGTKVFDASYDAWGKQTVTLNTIGLHRGYTGHEMLSEFDIINMNQRSLSRSGESNGRLYDPVLGRFFSPDNYVQMPDNSQNFNRYSYCLNNPLKYTDPSGEFFELIAFAAFNMASSMMQASFEGKSLWKAGALSLLSSAASYGIGEAFKKAAATFGNELLRAGAHGLASGVVSALDGGNFASAFVSGAAASGIGSYAKTIKGLETWQMVSSTTAMGGVVAWATGGDFLQGAMQGMMIGLFNHAAHDKGEGTSPLKVSVVTNQAGTYEFFVIGARKGGKGDVLAVATGMNTVLDGIGTSLKEHGGNSTFGSNGKFYWRTTGQRGFYGNQYVSATKLTTIGRRITKFTGPVGKTLDGIAIYDGYKQDGNQIGYHTVRATADVAGGWAGASAGAALGAEAGAAVGVWFGGVGAIPGAIIGGAVGGIIGTYGGGWLATSSVDMIYGR